MTPFFAFFFRLVICCRTTAATAMDRMRAMMAALKLTVNETKTRACRVPDETFDFLGYSFGRCYDRRTGASYLGAQPSRTKIHRLCREISELTDRTSLGLPVAELVEHLNRKLRGWRNYFCHGTVGRAYQVVNFHVENRLRQWLCAKHKGCSRRSARISAGFARFFRERALSPNDFYAGILKLRRSLGELEVTKPSHSTTGIASMDHATVATALLATSFASSLLPLTIRLLPVIAQVARLIVVFRAAEPTPAASHTFEARLQGLLRELGRIIVEWTFNHLEPDDPHLMPDHLRFDGDWYRRCNKKSPRRCVATLFGTITLWRYLYRPIHGIEASIFPLEIRLGLAVGRATPALAERAARAAADSTQGTVLADLKRDHAVAWSVDTLRAVIAVTWDGMAPQFHDAQVARVLAWLEQARASHGSRKPVLAVGRDGVFVPIRGDDSYREAATATLSVYDRAGVRSGTVYLGRMPESGQATLSDQLTRLITDVLAQWSGPLPRLAYITDAGHHPTEYYERVLRPMHHPCRPGERLEWEWVIDFYHACNYVYDLSETLFGDARKARAWGRKMCRWLKSKPRAVYRVLHSAAAIRSRRIVPGRTQAYEKAYGYLRDHIGELDYAAYRRDHLPIGSGVTEAACKTVFSQRLKRSGMAWSVEGGQRIVDLRVIDLSGVWSQVHQSYLQSKMLPEERGQGGNAKRKLEKAA